VTTTFFLVRHAAHDRVGQILCGRMPGVSLGDLGRRQAERLAERLATENVAAIRTSPLERARETAAPIAARCGLLAETCASLDEIDFGPWSGASFEVLAADPRWSEWNERRSAARPPAGETMQEAQARILAAMDSLRRVYLGRAVVLVSHGDVIKAALLRHLGLPIDAYGRFDIDPASISTVAVGDWGSRVLRLNEAVA